MKLCKALKIDTNAGYNKTVATEINNVLIALQKSGCTIDDVAQMGVDGRNAYIIVVYNDPSFDKPKVMPNVTTGTVPTNPATVTKAQ